MFARLNELIKQHHSFLYFCVAGVTNTAADFLVFTLLTELGVKSAALCQAAGYTVGIPSLGSQDTIAPAVSKGNETLLTWINDEIKALAAENFFHKDYEATLVDTYGLDYEDSLVLEGGGVTE